MNGKIDRLTEARSQAFKETAARKRLAMLFDSDSFVEIDGFATVDGAPSGVVCGYGAVMGSPAYAFAQDASEGGGAIGAVHAAKIKKIYDMALKTGAPVVGLYDSHGARITEGAGALDAYGEILLAANSLSGVVPQISVVLGVCAGSSAMLACGADYVILSDKAEFFLQPPTGDEPGAGSAENAALAGIAHIVASGEEAACEAARQLIARMPINNLAPPPMCDFSDPSGGTQALRTACEDMSVAKAEDIAASLLDNNSALELMGKFGCGAYTALGTIGGFPCGIVATRGGKLDADSCAKIARLVSVWDSFQIPVLTLVNATGFADEGDGLCGAVRDMARLSHVYAQATTAKVAVITGAAYGAAYVALASRGANADYTVAWPSASISALEPQTAVAFLYADRITNEKPRAQVEQEYIENEASPFSAAQHGYIEDVIDPGVTRNAVLAALDILSAKRVPTQARKHSNLPL